MKIAFLHFAEPYHCYHAAPMASAMAQLPGCEVVEFVNYAECQPHLTHIRQRLGVPALPQRTFRKSWPTHLLEKTRFLDAQRLRLLRENVAQLNEFDAVVATEYTAAVLKQAGLRSRLVYLSHGAGDRKVGDEDLVRYFDLALLPGPKMGNYLCAQGWLTPDQVRVTGAPKFELIPRPESLSSTSPFGERPYVLYNPHYKKSLNDWTRLLPLIVQMFRDPKKNPEGLGLMIAPHVKLFHEGWGGLARKLKRLEGENIRVDTGSMAMQDLTYTSTASVYLGDISSQFYEFLATPRPCVFLNPRQLEWRGNAYFRNWTLGDVVEDPSTLMDTLKAAPSRHALYRPAQEELLRETYGTESLKGAGSRAAEALRDWLLAHPAH